MKFVEALERLLPVVDDVHERWTQERSHMLEAHAQQPESPKITCTKGCGACCHFPIIPATAGEAFVLLARLLAEGQSLADLHSKFMPYARRYLEWAVRQNSFNDRHPAAAVFTGEITVSSLCLHARNRTLGRPLRSLRYSSADL